jgi:hypothetical protein
MGIAVPGASCRECTAYCELRFHEQQCRTVPSNVVLGAGPHAPIIVKPGCNVCISTLPGCVWELCNRFIITFLQVAEKEQTLSAEDDEDWSSHGTEHSGEALMEVTRAALAESEGIDVATLFAAVATFSRGQAILIEKIAQLERTVGTVQFDMTWVRDDMKAVHQVMERITEDVCDLRDVATKIEIPGEQVSMDVYTPTPWKGNEHAANVSKGPSASTSHGDPQSGNNYVPIRNASHDVAVNYMDDTPEFMFNTDVHLERMPSKDGSRLEWEHARGASPALWSPPGEQTRVSIEQKPLEEDSEWIKMSC